jgi:hypothetical protein
MQSDGGTVLGPWFVDAADIPSIASSAARMRKALTTQTAKNVCIARSGSTVIDGAARSGTETWQGKRFGS